MSEEEIQEMRDYIVDEYKELLAPSDNDLLVVSSTLKIRNVFAEVMQVRSWFDSTEVTTIEAMIRLDVLLGSLGVIKNEIKNGINSAKD